MTVTALQLQAIWIVLCQDPSLQYGIKNEDCEAIMRSCTDSLLCTTSLHEWDVYGGSVWSV
jgi:hypothetical protein